MIASMHATTTSSSPLRLLIRLLVLNRLDDLIRHSEVFDLQRKFCVSNDTAPECDGVFFRLRCSLARSILAGGGICRRRARSGRLL